MPKAELETFAGWVDVATGKPEQELRRLPVAATPLLGVILETLLAAHDFDTFEKLVGLLNHSALAEREQRELLASLYLKHGFLQSAAQEWMAVCQTNPDVRALLGLARVARANGQLEDAAVFAGEVIKADPTQRRRPRDPRPGRLKGTRTLPQPPHPGHRTTGQLNGKTKEALKFSAVRSITPPEREGFPRNR